MDIEKVLSITLFSAYGIIFLIGGVGISFVTLEKRKARRSLRESISKKIWKNSFGVAVAIVQAIDNLRLCKEIQCS